MALRTRVTERLGIEAPIVLAPMGNWSERSLAAAVSNGGGLGTFGAAGRVMGLTEQYVRDTIAELRERTDRPFGAGFITQLIAENPANLDIVLEEGVPVVLFSFADPTPYLALAQQTSATTICQVQSFAAAQVAVDAGADLLAVQGNEAGGHTGEQHLLPFLVRVLDAFPDVPVVAAGGISGGRGLAAVLAAGADGAWMGTAVPGRRGGRRGRAGAARRDPRLRWHGHDLQPCLRPRGHRRLRRGALPRRCRLPHQALPTGRGVGGPGGRAPRGHRRGRAAFRAGVRAGDPDYTPLIYGPGAGAITGVRPAREIIEEITGDAARRLARG